MAEQKTDALSVDNSLIDPQTDRLGYAPFAKYLADSICKMTITQGFVIAVYGSWNSGKSTLMNFIVHYLQQQPENERPIIVPFNPWLFSGSEDITKRFFEQIQNVLSKISSVSKTLRERIGDFAKAVGETSLPYAEAGKAVATLFDAQQKDASELKEEVEDTLTKQQQRIVVAVDDIDRLPPEDIKQLFRLLKAIPSFTNVVYLLFFNKKIVIKALTETQEKPENYIDKIVQVSFELPFPDKTSLRRLLFEKLDRIMIDIPEKSIPLWQIYLLPFLVESRSYSLFKYIFSQLEVSLPKDLFDPVYWNKIYYQGIDYFITDLHDILRLIDTLSLTYPIVKGEVNPVDFIALESLRIFCPIVYDIIRKNKNAFIGDDDYSLDEIKSFHNSWIAELQDEDKQHIKKLLMLLFPKLEAVWGVRSYEKKAKELFDMFESEIYNVEAVDGGGWENCSLLERSVKNVAKNCATNAVKEMIADLNSYRVKPWLSLTSALEMATYWEQVKTEIEKL